MILRILLSIGLLLVCLPSCSAASSPMQEQEHSKQQVAALGTPQVGAPQSGTPQSGAPQPVAPSPSYWQQQVDYNIKVTLEPSTKRLTAAAQVRYQNHSPYPLSELWFELPQQRFAPTVTPSGTKTLMVKDGAGKALKANFHDTFVSVTLPSALAAHSQQTLYFEWDLSLIPRTHELSPRSGYEQLDDNTQLFGVAQWYPRAVALDKAGQWSRLPFLGRGEFSLELGNIEVEISLPDAYLVFATGELTNPKHALNKEAYAFWSNVSETPKTFVFSPPSSPSNAEPIAIKTWAFKAQQVRDFSFAAANNVIWQSQRVALKAHDVRLNAVFPNNGRWLWNRYALAATRHAVSYLDTELYPYPFTTLNVFNIAGISMEYPGMVFVGFRGPNSDLKADFDRYSRTEKYDVIGGIIHEVAHSYFPMYVNTDERREGFLDEGLTSYLSFKIEQAWNPNFQSFYGKPWRAKGLFEQAQLSAPVTQADQLVSKLDSHYHLPALALNVLDLNYPLDAPLMTLLGRFIEQWRGKRATFDDLKGYLNSQSSVSLDEFWQDWFYSPKAVDYRITQVRAWEGHDVASDNDATGLVRLSQDDNLTQPLHNPMVPEPLGASVEGQSARLQDRYSSQTDNDDVDNVVWAQCHSLQEGSILPGIVVNIEQLGAASPTLKLSIITAANQVISRTVELPLKPDNKVTEISWLFTKPHQIKCVVLDIEQQSGDINPTNNVIKISQ